MVLKVEYADDSELADATENLSGGGFFIQTARKFELAPATATMSGRR